MIQDVHSTATRDYDPGGKSHWPLQPGVRGDAVFSACNRYRHVLWRFWTAEPAPTFALWIGCNPSTAEANVDDPTVRKEMHFTRAMGFTAYCKVNVMDLRATDPKKLLEWGAVPNSSANFVTIRQIAERASRIIAAWGALPKPLRIFAIAIEAMLNHKPIYCMGVTKDGQPRHPLYLRNDATPIIWRAAK